MFISKNELGLYKEILSMYFNGSIGEKRCVELIVELVNILR